MKTGFPLLALGLLAGCTVGPAYQGPPRVAADVAARGTFVRTEDPALAGTPGLARWWTSLGDPVLDTLVDEALAHSPTIEAAQARIREAGAQLDTQRANGLPSLSANGTVVHAELPGVGESGDSTSLEFYNLGAMASWEPDLFGGGRRGIEKARATVDQRFADLADAQVSLSAQVAQAYVNLRDVEARARFNAASTALQRQALDLTRQRFAAGTASALDVERLQAQLDNTDAQNLPLTAQRDEYRDQLAILTGRVPGALDSTLSAQAPVPLPPAMVPVGDPATLIANRPDIRAAERALAAGSAQIGVSKAKLFPSLQFLGILGLGGTSPGDAVDPGNLTTVLAPMLRWSFLDFGRNRAAIRQSEAQRDEAEAQYRQKVLSALQDAETSLSRFGNRRQQLAQYLQVQASAGRSAQLNAQRVAAGTSATIDQLDIERQRLAAEIAVSQAQAQLTGSYIAVQKSLGLGWTRATAD